jgi:hypothetical protein
VKFVIDTGIDPQNARKFVLTTGADWKGIGNVMSLLNLELAPSPWM